MNGEEEEEGIIPFVRLKRAQEDRRLSPRPCAEDGRAILSLVAVRHAKGVLGRLQEFLPELYEKARECGYRNDPKMAVRDAVEHLLAHYPRAAEGYTDKQWQQSIRLVLGRRLVEASAPAPYR